jgi:rod shape-determining protein MreC
MNTVPARRVGMSLLGFIVVCLVFLALDRGNALDPLRDGLSQVFAPISTTFEEIGQRSSGGTDLDKQLAAVTAERDKLQAENIKLQAVEQENANLRKQLGAQEARPDLAYFSARVIGRDPSGAQLSIIINKGSADGVQKGMAVVDPNFYVGQVSEVQEHTAKVLLIGDQNASVGAMLVDAKADGIVYGRWQSGGLLTMEHVNKDVKPKEKEWVVTSDVAASETARVPANIPIGIVVGEPVLNAQKDQLEITVQPAANVEQLDTVWIAVPHG